MSLYDALAPVVERHLYDTFPACSISVVHQGNVFDQAWGVIDPDGERHPVTKDTLFDLASLTKLFTTTAFLRFVSEGRIGLDDPLVKVVPEFGGAPRPIEGGHDPHSKERLPTPPELIGQEVDPARVTFRHLLTHTSGLPPWRDVYNAAGDAPLSPDQRDLTARAVRWSQGLAALIDYPFVGQPDGKTVRYSDVGLMLLGEAVSRLDPDDGRDLAVTLDRLIFAAVEGLYFNPIRVHAISKARIAPTEIDATWRKRRAWGEVHDENACGVGGVAGHAGLFGTARAVAAFGETWLRLVKGGDGFGIAPEVAHAATHLQVDDNGTRRGLGFALKGAVDSMAGDRLSMNSFGHSGFTGTTLWIDPDHDLVITLLTNRVYPGRWHTGAHGDIHDFRRAAHDAIAGWCGVT